MTIDDFAGQFEALIDGGLDGAPAEAFLQTLSAQGETAQNLIIAATILRARAVSMDALPQAVDLCGTGGDAAGTVNISTAAAFVAAASGLAVAKHGNRAASSHSGSSDVLQALGVAMATNADSAADQFARFGLTFLSAPDFHPALVRLAPLRKRIGRRTIFNLLGPLLNPAGVKRQLVGVYAPTLTRMMAEALQALGSDSAWTVHGDGLDELTVTGASKVTVLNAGKLSEITIDPVRFGMPRRGPESLRGGIAAENATALEAMLNGAAGAYRDIVVLNAAAALIVGSRAETMMQGLTLARAAIDSGAALDLLRRMRQH